MQVNSYPQTHEHINEHDELVVGTFLQFLQSLYQDPHLAYFRIYEHGKKRIPLVVQQKIKMKDQCNQVNGAQEDAVYAQNQIDEMLVKSTPKLDNILYLIESCIELHHESNTSVSSAKATGAPLLPKSL